MNRIIEAIKNRLAIFMSEYLMPDYEAHKRAALMYTSANTIYLQRELKKTKKQLKVAQSQVYMFKSITDEIVAEVMKADVSESTPLVHDVVLKLENGRRYCG